MGVWACLGAIKATAVQQTPAGSEEGEVPTGEHDIGKGGERASLAAQSFPKVIPWGGGGIGAESTGVVGIALEGLAGNTRQI